MRKPSALLSLIGWVGMSLGCTSPTAGPDAARVAFFNPCFQQPNYISEVQLNRWRSFPLRYYFDSDAFDQELVDAYRGAVTIGVHRWSEATGNDLGRVIEVEDRRDAQFIITFGPATPEETFARTTHEAGDPFLSGGQITFNSLYVTEIEQQVHTGEIDLQTFSRAVAGSVAHEMGHLLGIIGHSTRTDVLMGSAFLDAPTSADINTLTHAYCSDM